MASFIFSYHSAAQRLIMDGWMDGDHGRNGPNDSSGPNGPNGPPKWSKYSIGHASIMGWSKMEDHDHGYIGLEILLVKVKYILLQ